MIEYYESKVSPNYYVVSVDNVMVAFWHCSRWIDRGIYRPVRIQTYKKVEWNGPAFDTALISNPKEFKFVKRTGREMTSEELESTFSVTYPV
jgi:hypothetical protein